MLLAVQLQILVQQRAVLLLKGYHRLLFAAFKKRARYPALQHNKMISFNTSRCWVNCVRLIICTSAWNTFGNMVFLLCCSYSSKKPRVYQRTASHDSSEGTLSHSNNRSTKLDRNNARSKSSPQNCFLRTYSLQLLGSCVLKV